MPQSARNRSPYRIHGMSYAILALVLFSLLSLNLPLREWAGEGDFVFPVGLPREGGWPLIWYEVRGVDSLTITYAPTRTIVCNTLISICLLGACLGATQYSLREYPHLRRLRLSMMLALVSGLCSVLALQSPFPSPYPVLKLVYVVEELALFAIYVAIVSCWFAAFRAAIAFCRTLRSRRRSPCEWKSPAEDGHRRKVVVNDALSESGKHRAWWRFHRVSYLMFLVILISSMTANMPLWAWLEMNARQADALIGDYGMSWQWEGWPSLWYEIVVDERMVVEKVEVQRLTIVVAVIGGILLASLLATEVLVRELVPIPYLEVSIGFALVSAMATMAALEIFRRPDSNYHGVVDAIQFSSVYTIYTYLFVCWYAVCRCVMSRLRRRTSPLS
jgi:hypothetical protein